MRYKLFSKDVAPSYEYTGAGKSAHQESMHYTMPSSFESEELAGSFHGNRYCRIQLDLVKLFG